MIGLIYSAVIGLMRGAFGAVPLVSGLLSVAWTRIQSSGGSLKLGSAAGVDFADNGGNTVGMVNQLGDARFLSSLQIGGVIAEGATTLRSVAVKKTGIADNTATDVLTVNVPNANHAAAIRLTFLSSNGGADAFESSRVASGMVVLARTTGANVVATAVALSDAGIATVALGATHTLAYDLSAISGAAGATNTFTIRVTIDDSGNLGSNQVVVLAELINAETSGVSVSAA